MVLIVRLVVVVPKDSFMQKTNIYVLIFLFLAGCFLGTGSALAQGDPMGIPGIPRLVYLQSGDVQISNPETAQAFYDELKGKSKDYFIDSKEDFELYLNLLIPKATDLGVRYSADVFLLKDSLVGLDQTAEKIATVDGASLEWQKLYEPASRDYYLKGPEFSKQVSAGKYKIEIYSLGRSPTGEAENNQGKYVLTVGKKQSYDTWSILNIYWQLPLLKATFLKTSVLQFFLTPFGIVGVAALGVLLIFLAFINYSVGVINEAIKRRQAKTLLLTSNGMQPMQDEIIKLLQKPAYDVTVAFITTAYKYKVEQDPNYQSKDLQIMRELGFNVEEVDIEGKKEHEVMRLLALKDIIFVAGGNTFYLLKAMKECNFEKVIRKLLQEGRVYIGASAGSIVAGRTIKTANKFGTGEKGNFVKLKDLRGLNLVPFNIFVHYQPEHADLIKQNISSPKKRAKNLRILTDDQAILVQGKEIDLIGDGEAVII